MDENIVKKYQGAMRETEKEASKQCLSQDASEEKIRDIVARLSQQAGKSAVLLPPAVQPTCLFGSILPSIHLISARQSTTMGDSA
jgi:hypothetical protein